MPRKICEKRQKANIKFNPLWKAQWPGLVAEYTGGTNERERERETERYSHSDDDNDEEIPQLDRLNVGKVAMIIAVPVPSQSL